MSLRRPTPWVLAAAALAFTACSADSRPTAGDRAFVGDLLPHHHVGMTLIADATTRTDDVRLRRMVFEMGSYHGQEISLLERWASDWGVGPDDHFPGQVGAPALERLATKVGPAHDIWWLHLMIEHHEGALVISRRAITSQGLDAIDDIASKVEQVQSTELVAMKTLLAELCAENAAAGCPSTP